MKFIGIIPARYASTRFPGKPLADMKGKYMIQRVYEQARKVLDNVCVATDDDRIFNAVKSFGGNVVMTSAEHRSGTDRCFEAYNRLGGNEDVIINIQGDEPFIKPEQIESLIACFDSPQTQIATLVRPFEATEGYEALAQSQLSEGHSQRQKRSTLFQPFDNSLYEKYIPRTMAR